MAIVLVPLKHKCTFCKTFSFSSKISFYLSQKPVSAACCVPTCKFILFYNMHIFRTNILKYSRSHDGTLVTRSPPTFEVGGSNPEPYVGKMVVSYRWLLVCCTEPRPTVCTGFLCY